jgi:hypothetical protein
MTVLNLNPPGMWGEFEVVAGARMMADTRDIRDPGDEPHAQTKMECSNF